MTTGLPLTKSVHNPLAKSNLVPLVLRTGVSATEAIIQIKIFGSGTTLVFSNEEIDDIKNS